MAWKVETARERIRRFIDSVPEGQIVVEDFTRYFAQREVVAKASVGMTAESEPLLRIPRNQAITTHGVHVYANLINYNDHLIEAGRETEASHARALQFLHTHYRACDALIVALGLQRVDFHGSRLHAVVLTPTGADQEGARVAKAMAFAAAFRQMVQRTAGRYGSAFETGVRVGVDSGPAIAMDGGKRDEPEPVFIGSPANYAAKLADGSEEGVFPSPRVRRLLNDPHAFDERIAIAKSLEDHFLNEEVVVGRITASADSRMDVVFASLSDEMDLRKSLSGSAAEAAFYFHHMDPPLRTINYADHPPSNAIRMPLASIFADLDGFTAYVDKALETGRVAEAVSNLHVLRAEMAAVIRDDFDGRKVRFIGDCVHGLLAEGDSRQTDEARTVERAALAAGGVRSSFELCRSMLPGVNELGIAIGIDLGPTPICRLGLRGEGSVRAASSRATCVSEEEQRACDGRETAIGLTAYAAAPAAVRQAFGPGRKIPNLTYDNAVLLFGTMASPYLGRAEPEPMRAHQAPPMRAHSAS